MTSKKFAFTKDAGDRIRHLRKEMNLRLKDLAGKAGVSLGHLSGIERGQAVPSVTALARIAEVLGTPLPGLFDEQPVPRGHRYLVRKGERRTIVYPGAQVRNELLVPDLRRKMEALVSKIVPGTASPVYEHQGEDFGYILKGRLRFWVGDEEFLLEEGDSISFPAHLPHYWIHPKTARPAETLWVITPPTW